MMTKHFASDVGKTIQKILMNINLVKIIQCRNSYERRIVHTLAEEHGLEHKKILMKHMQKKRFTPMYKKNGVRKSGYEIYNIEEYYDNIYGVRLSSPVSVRREPELRKKLAHEILCEVLIDDVAKIVCKKM